MKKLNEILGTEYPIIQGGMANIATGEFAAACSNAGALGMIATGGWDGDRLRQEIRRAKELTDKPFGVNLMLMSPYADDIAQIIAGGGREGGHHRRRQPRQIHPRLEGGRASRCCPWWRRQSWPSAWSATAWTPSSPRAPSPAAMWAR